MRAQGDYVDDPYYHSHLCTRVVMVVMMMVVMMMVMRMMMMMCDDNVDIAKVKLCKW